MAHKTTGDHNRRETKSTDGRSADITVWNTLDYCINYTIDIFESSTLILSQSKDLGGGMTVKYHDMLEEGEYEVDVTVAGEAHSFEWDYNGKSNPLSISIVENQDVDFQVFEI